MSAFIKAAKISKIFCHESFPAGSPPLSLKLKKEMFFQPKSNKDLAILRAAHSADKARVLWLVGVGDGKLMHKGLVVMCTASCP